MNWTVTIGALAVLVVSALVLWKTIRKNVAKEIAYDINRETEDEITRLVEQAEQIEADPDPTDKWL